MLTIDEIKIEPDEDGFYLTIYTDEPARVLHGGQWVVVGPDVPHTLRLRIGLPDQFLTETERTIGAWLAEGERAAMQHKLDQGYQPDSRNVELDEAWPGQTSLEDLIDTGAADMYRDRERGK